MWRRVDKVDKKCSPDERMNTVNQNKCTERNGTRPYVEKEERCRDEKIERRRNMRGLQKEEK